MSAVVAEAAGNQPLVTILSPEWDRMQALVEIAVNHRSGVVVSDEVMTRLRHASALVRNMRAGGAWRAVERVVGICATESPLLYDALAVSLLPHVRPSTAFGLMTLNHASQGQTAPTTGALYEILALGAADDRAFFAAVRQFDVLTATGLTRVGGDAPLRELHPGTLLGRLVFEIDEPLETPPGVVRLSGGPALEALVLPPESLGRIRHVLDGARFADALHERGEAGPPQVVLLAGPPGTGKTLAAQAMAAALGRPLFRVDFGLVLSKWVGETEKNLSRIFDTLHGLGAALLIDECDTLLSKRVPLKEGRENHSNTTTGHLLARLERHDGLVFLTTNLSENIDDAYFRRFAHVIGFDRPGRTMRRRIWARHLPAAETGARDALLDLAASPRLTGGEIANAAVNARALAFGEGRLVEPRDVALAVWREVTKVPRTVGTDDLGALAGHLPPLEPQS